MHFKVWTLSFWHSAYVWKHRCLSHASGARTHMWLYIELSRIHTCTTLHWWGVNAQTCARMQSEKLRNYLWCLYTASNNIHKSITRLWLVTLPCRQSQFSVQFSVIIVQSFVITVQFCVITVQFSVITLNQTNKSSRYRFLQNKTNMAAALNNLSINCLRVENI
jgi:uncharacterized membrane protein